MDALKSSFEAAYQTTRTFVMKKEPRFPYEVPISFSDDLVQTITRSFQRFIRNTDRIQMYDNAHTEYLITRKIPNPVDLLADLLLRQHLEFLIRNDHSTPHFDFSIELGLSVSSVYEELKTKYLMCTYLRMYKIFSLQLHKFT
jgi:hypothetical protein